MLELQNRSLSFGFPEIHPDAKFSIDFQRTLRIPDNNKEYPLPPGFGSFPLSHVDDFADHLPKEWIAHGGVFLPMYQSEAMWVNFDSRYPFAVKVAAGKVNAITGDAWSMGLADISKNEAQDYAVIPDQPWLDGFAVAKGKIRQFVAMPLGQGFSAEEQITGESEHGGIQIVAYPMKTEFYEKYKNTIYNIENHINYCMEESKVYDKFEMGLALGGLMKQDIYKDRFGSECWDTSNYSRCFVHILNSEKYIEVTGSIPPTKAPSAGDYTKAGLPWFDYYSENNDALSGSEILGGLKSAGDMAAQSGQNKSSISDDPAPSDTGIVSLGNKDSIRDGIY